MSGKGDRQRPVDPKTFGENFMNIFKKKKNESSITKASEMDVTYNGENGDEFFWDNTGHRIRTIIIGMSNPETRHLIEQDCCCYKFVGFFDDNYKLDGYGHVKDLKDVDPKTVRLLNGVCGNTKSRKKVFDKYKDLGYTFLNFIPKEIRFEPFYLDDLQGLYIQKGVQLQADVTLNDNVTIHQGTLIAHECYIGEGAFIGPGANLCGRVQVGSLAYVGAGAIILPDVTIGAGAVIGAGSVVTKDVPAGATVKGSPAK